MGSLFSWGTSHRLSPKKKEKKRKTLAANLTIKSLSALYRLQPDWNGPERLDRGVQYLEALIWEPSVLTPLVRQLCVSQGFPQPNGFAYVCRHKPAKTWKRDAPAEGGCRALKASADRKTKITEYFPWIRTTQRKMLSDQVLHQGSWWGLRPNKNIYY